jgi:hypothetical protein
MLLELKLDPIGWFKQVFKPILTRNLVQSTIGKINPFWTTFLFNSLEMAYSNGDLVSWHVAFNVSSVCFKICFLLAKVVIIHRKIYIYIKVAIIPRKIHPRYKVQGKRVHLIKNMKNLPCLI